VVKKPLENSEIFHANSEKSERFQRKSEKSKRLYSTLLQLSHGCSFDTTLTEASKDWHILERIIEVATTGA